MERLTLDKFPPSVLAKIDVQRAFVVSRLLVACERLQLFRALSGRPLRAETLGRRLHVHRNYLLPLLKSLVSLGLLREKDGLFSNTPFADKYFVQERSIHWTRQYSVECMNDYNELTVLEKALASGRSSTAIRRVHRPSYTEQMMHDRRQAEDFTQMLFHLHRDLATALAGHLDLSTREAVLDLGGGSGVMSIALAKRNPHLRLCVFDIAPVCKIAARNVRQARLSRQIGTLVGELRRALPRGFDVMMCCDIGEIAPALLRRIYRSLPAGGLIVLVDRYLRDDGVEPLDRLLEGFLPSSFGLATRADMVRALESCGFVGVQAQQFYKDVWCITGDKPCAVRTRPSRSASARGRGVVVP